MINYEDQFLINPMLNDGIEKKNYNTQFLNNLILKDKIEKELNKKKKIELLEREIERKKYSIKKDKTIN
jgi:hypothetical protein